MLLVTLHIVIKRGLSGIYCWSWSPQVKLQQIPWKALKIQHVVYIKLLHCSNNGPTDTARQVTVKPRFTNCYIRIFWSSKYFLCVWTWANAKSLLKWLYWNHWLFCHTFLYILVITGPLKKSGIGIQLSFRKFNLHFYHPSLLMAAFVLCQHWSMKYLLEGH